MRFVRPTYTSTEISSKLVPLPEQSKPETLDLSAATIISQTPTKPTRSAYTQFQLTPQELALLNEKTCKACNNTGVNSRGGPCHPCTVRVQLALQHSKFLKASNNNEQTQET